MRLQTASTLFSERHGILIRARDGGGAPWSYGEISPIHTHSRESLEDCWVYLKEGGRAPASVRFAVDTQKNWANILSGPEAPVSSNAILDVHSDLKEVERRLREGYRTFKLKVSPASLSLAINIMEATKKIASDALFRLDASASFSGAAIFEEAKKLSRLPIEYFEDPCAPDDRAWTALADAGVAIAVDQGLRSVDDIRRLLDRIPFTVAVLKPSVLGGMDELQRAVAILTAAGRRSVITSSLETEVGRAALIYLADRLLPNEVHGLSTGDLFDENFFGDQASHDGSPVFAHGWSLWINSLSWEALS